MCQFIVIYKSKLCYRHLELTDEDKEKLKGSIKVAKKLEKMEGKNMYE